ncbi:hypothetical protein WJX77_011204 [Trebouxia sp. C0004]
MLPQLSSAGSIQDVPLTWVPPIVRTATPKCILGPHAKDSKAVKCQAQPVKSLGRTSKRRTHKMRCSLARKARPTPSTQGAGTRMPQETGGRASNFPAPSIEVIQPRAQAAGRWQTQGLTDPVLLQGIAHDKGDISSGADQLRSPQFNRQAYGSSPTPVSPGSPPGMWHQGHTQDLPAMLNTPMAIRRLSHILDASFQEQDYNMKAGSPIPILPRLGWQCDAYNSQLHGHQLTPGSLSGFILSPPNSLDQTSLDTKQSAPQQPMSRAPVQSKAVLSQGTKLPVHSDDGVGCVTAFPSRPAPRDMHHCTGLDVSAAWDCVSDGKDRGDDPTTNSTQMAGSLDGLVIAGLPRAADQDTFHLTVLNSVMAHLLMLQTAREMSSIVLMLKFLFSCPMTQALLVETQIVYAVRPFKQHSHARVACLARACMQMWVQLSRSG